MRQQVRLSSLQHTVTRVEAGISSSIRIPSTWPASMLSYRKLKMKWSCQQFFVNKVLLEQSK
jgi:hypothetical protein